MIEKQIDVDASVEIEVGGFTDKGVSLTIRILRKRLEGFREDAVNSIFQGVTLKEFDYHDLQAGTRVTVAGLKAVARVVEE